MSKSKWTDEDGHAFLKSVLGEPTHLKQGHFTSSVEVRRANVDGEEVQLFVSLLREEDVATLQNLQEKLDGNDPDFDLDEVVTIPKIDPEGSTEPPHTFALEMLLPTSIATDYIDNLREVYLTKWMPVYGEASAKRLWYRNCAGMVINHWFGVLTLSVERIRKVFWSF